MDRKYFVAKARCAMVLFLAFAYLSITESMWFFGLALVMLWVATRCVEFAKKLG